MKTNLQIRDALEKLSSLWDTNDTLKRPERLLAVYNTAIKEPVSASREVYAVISDLPEKPYIELTAMVPKQQLFIVNRKFIIQNDPELSEEDVYTFEPIVAFDSVPRSPETVFKSPIIPSDCVDTKRTRLSPEEKFAFDVIMKQSSANDTSEDIRALIKNMAERDFKKYIAK